MLFQRMLRAARLESALYEEVEHDASATTQAFLVIAIVSLAGSLWALLHLNVVGVLLAILGTAVGWVIWAVMTWLVGTKLFGGTADVGEMLRVLGFAATPMVLGIIPLVGALVGFIWMLVCGVVAVRQGLDFSTEKAIATIVIAALPALLLIALIMAIVS
jgi:hypothetical protein